MLVGALLGFFTYRSTKTLLLFHSLTTAGAYYVPFFFFMNLLTRPKGLLEIADEAFFLLMTIFVAVVQHCKKIDPCDIPDCFKEGHMNPE